MTLKEFSIKYSICANRAEVDKQLSRLPRPATLEGKETPTDLNSEAYGTIIALQQGLSNGRTDIERISNCASVLLGVTITDESSVEDCFGFGQWVAKEVERIARLFNSIKTEPTQEEIQAGVKELNFGYFGTLDWYCKRMGLTNHEEAEKTPWVRIYKCMDMDNKTAQYERRLRQIYSKKQR